MSTQYSNEAIFNSFAHNRFAYGLLLIVSLACVACGKRHDDPTQRKLFEFLYEGTQALEKSEYERALALVDSAAKLDGKNVNVEFLRGRVLSEVGRYEEAKTAYLKVKEYEPNYRGVWNNLGNNAYRQTKYQDAVFYYKREIAENDTSFLAWRGLGRAYSETGAFESAHQAFDKAIQVNPDFAGTYYSKAILNENEGKLELARELARRAASLAPKNLEYRFTYGSLLVKTGRPEEAIPYLTPVVEQWPWHHGALYNLGQAYIRTGRKGEAQKYLERAEKARALQAKIELQEQSVVNLSQNPFAYAALGSALRRAGRHDDALIAYKVAHHLAPTNYEIENNMANLYLIKKDTARAIDHYRAIVERDPTLVAIWINLGVVEVLRGNTKAAREAWVNALRHDPNNPLAQTYLARLQRGRQ